MKKVTQKLVQWFVQPIIKKRIARSSVYTYKNITLHIPAGVFHPGYFFSTHYLLEQVLLLPLQNKNLLELGAGNGLISIAAAKAGAKVTSSDISKQVIKNLETNTLSNNVSLFIIESDLFENIQFQHFDYIIINPPYYPKKARNDFELAWYCGENFEYYEKLFPQLNNRISEGTLVLMVLSDTCDVKHIKTIADKSNLVFSIYHSKRIWWEQETIFAITHRI